ncbi:MAG TPA: hypothetical protein VF443_06275 [Nitrospira sp.]
MRDAVAYYLYKVIAEDSLIESEGSASDMASMIDLLYDLHDKDKIQFMYIEEREHEHEPNQLQLI